MSSVACCALLLVLATSCGDPAANRPHGRDTVHIRGNAATNTRPKGKPDVGTHRHFADRPASRPHRPTTRIAHASHLASTGGHSNRATDSHMVPLAAISGAERAAARYAVGAAAAYAAGVERRIPSFSLPSQAGSSPAAPAASPVSDVMACIRQHESGNYQESSHPGSGSGAYQYTPGTWSIWSSKAGYGGFLYAYQAPPSVQDAVTVFTLTHGGAHNWDPRYGNDPCTVGMP
jgi:hypothetical protein